MTEMKHRSADRRLRAARFELLLTDEGWHVSVNAVSPTAEDLGEIVRGLSILGEIAMPRATAEPSQEDGR